MMRPTDSPGITLNAMRPTTIISNISNTYSIRHHQTPPDTTRHHQTPPDTTRYHQIPPDTTRYHQILTNVATSPKMTTILAVQGISVTKYAKRVFCFGVSIILQE